jgi:hypothetical protein
VNDLLARLVEAARTGVVFQLFGKATFEVMEGDSGYT